MTRNRISISLDTELIEKLREDAKKTHRNLSMLIEYMIEQYYSIADKEELEINKELIIRLTDEIGKYYEEIKKERD